MSLAFDESGRPFIILREQGKKKRVKGLEAHKINILAARTVASLLKTSLGPKGMDKMLVSPDGEVIITNDGATILEKMEVSINQASNFCRSIIKLQSCSLSSPPLRTTRSVTAQPVLSCLLELSWSKPKSFLIRVSIL